ncbi:A/G-specific adenine glycosylase [Ancylobacter terrae]|uniref:A/G-specific adenine glycosylase n=1 Tax=Ancylobacter sp. sgz301288 TaxID=3342077 RepID=UPI0038595D86
MPWRAEPGERADPYRVFLSEIMLQQTTVVTVGPYFTAFLTRWPDVGALARAPLDDVLRAWAGLGYYARARNLHACVQAVVQRHGGRFPDDEAALLALPGIGPYTAAAIAAIAYDRRAAPVDGNWERVIARVFAVDEPLPRAKPRLKALAGTLLPDARHGDFAQAMMDLGATLCTPRSPACPRCPWRQACAAHAQGAPERYPLKAANALRPTRRGIAFLAVRADGAVLVRNRPPKGLLGGMAEVPSTPWDARLARGGAAPPEVEAQEWLPIAADWRPLAGTVSHVFSHFALELGVWRADVPAAAPAPAGHRWVSARDLAGEAFPSLMRKVLAHGSDAGGD